MSTNCRLSCDRCQYVRNGVLFRTFDCWPSAIVSFSFLFLYFPFSIVRVHNADEIRKFIERKNKETEVKRQALKEKKEINKILQGEL